MSTPVRRLRTPLFALGAAALGLVFATRIETDNRIDGWADPPPDLAGRYESFQRTFGSDEFVLATVEGPGLLDAELLDLQIAVLDDLEALPWVSRVLSPASLYRDLFGSEEPYELLTELTSTDFYTGLLISADRTAVAYFIEVAPPDDSRACRRLVAAIDAGLAPLREGGLVTRLVGPPVITSELDAASVSEARRSLPLAAVASIALLFWLLRSPVSVFIALSCSAVTISVVLGLMGVLGMRLNLFTAALPSLLWVLSLATILHLLVRYHSELRQRDSEAALDAAVGRARFPCSLSAVTTAAGFFSLNLAPMRPVRELGNLAGVGLLVSLGVSFWLGPALVRALHHRGKHAPRTLARLADLSATAFRRPWAVTVPFLVVLGLGAISLTSLRQSSNPLSFLPAGSPVLEDYRRTARHLGGMSTLEIVVPAPNGWLRPDFWDRARRLEEALLAEDAAGKIRSPLDLLAKLRQWDGSLQPDEYRLPVDTEEAARLVDTIDPILEPELRSLVSNDGNEVRFSVLTHTMDSEEFSHLERRAREELSLHFGDQGSVTGIVTLLVDAQRRLIRSQVRSLLSVLTVILVVIAIGQRSLKWATLAMLPNLAPVATVFLAMTALRLPIDPGTIMVAGVALGIAVDDSVHLVTSIRRHHGDEISERAVTASVAEVGPALVVTTLTATAGFFSLASAQFPPIRYFGLLTSLAMLVALAASLWLLPALLGLGSQRKSGSLSD